MLAGGEDVASVAGTRDPKGKECWAEAGGHLAGYEETRAGARRCPECEVVLAAASGGDVGRPPPRGWFTGGSTEREPQRGAAGLGAGMGASPKRLAPGNCRSRTRKNDEIRVKTER